ncbi:MAG: hypothetical protein HY335_07915 [Deinococcus sp.]|nr:hypothetical protein [Deinococcus sp.]
MRRLWGVALLLCLMLPGVGSAQRARTDLSGQGTITVKVRGEILGVAAADFQTITLDFYLKGERWVSVPREIRNTGPGSGEHNDGGEENVQFIVVDEAENLFLLYTPRGDLNLRGYGQLIPLADPLPNDPRAGDAVARQGRFDAQSGLVNVVRGILGGFDPFLFNKPNQGGEVTYIGPGQVNGQPVQVYGFESSFGGASLHGGQVLGRVFFSEELTLPVLIETQLTFNFTGNIIIFTITSELTEFEDTDDLPLDRFVLSDDAILVDQEVIEPDDPEWAELVGTLEDVPGTGINGTLQGDLVVNVEFLGVTLPITARSLTLVDNLQRIEQENLVFLRDSQGGPTLVINKDEKTVSTGSVPGSGELDYFLPGAEERLGNAGARRGEVVTLQDFDTRIWVLDNIRYFVAEGLDMAVRAENLEGANVDVDTVTGATSVALDLPAFLELSNAAIDEPVDPSLVQVPELPFVRDRVLPPGDPERETSPFASFEGE